ncbi:MAG: ATPase, partial [Bacteroidetes bacterium]|nr:ATPase [Bacteroidota bacterium]
MLQTKSKSPSVFNPHNQTSKEIVANFVVRLGVFNEIFNAVRKDKMDKPPQHFIIQGQRGYGKTTLLLRLNLEIKSDSKLSKWLIPVMFDEEQYSVHTLAKLWEEIIDILEEREESFSGLSDEVDSLYDTDTPEEEIFNLLIDALKERNKKIVLLLDNFGDMTKKFTKKETQRLREVLLTCNHIRLIGASSVFLEFHYDYKEPFFDFFKVITLDILSQDETITLLRKLAETYEAKEIEKIIKEQPERIEAIRRLTGGVPRTIVLLFGIFLDDADGNSIRDLETILDTVTSRYKHRLDNLSPQQQAIIDSIAQNWDAISTKEIAEKVRMPGKAVSSQLNQLVKNQLIKKIPTSTKNQLYQVSERFFNIYYLMRLGKRKSRKRVLWLIKFFELWCGEKELIERTQKQIKAIKENRIYEKH